MHELPSRSTAYEAFAAPLIHLITVAVHPHPRRATGNKQHATTELGASPGFFRLTKSNPVDDKARFIQSSWEGASSASRLVDFIVALVALQASI